MEKIIKQIIRDNKTPLYVYDYDIIKKNIFKLIDIMPPNGRLYYSMKANPNLAICQIIEHLIGRVEVSSLGEIKCAIEAGFEIKNILFSGPGKTGEELEFAINSGIQIIVESIEELEAISNICRKGDVPTGIMIRINPDFASKTTGFVMTGKASQFGIDVCDIDKSSRIIKNNEMLKLKGISVYLGSQILDANIILENTRKIINLFLMIQKKLNVKLSQLDVGGGFGVSYYDKKELDIDVLQAQMEQMVLNFHPYLENVEIFYESGRYIMAESGYFITKILYKKKSKGRNYLICDGGFNNMYISSFCTRDLRGNFPMRVLRENQVPQSFEEYFISGPLCSPKDIIGSKIKLPIVNSGDYLIVCKVGAYGLTYSPVLFISHEIPGEILIKGNQYFVIRDRSSELTKQFKLPENVVGNEENRAQWRDQDE